MGCVQECTYASDYSQSYTENVMSLFKMLHHAAVAQQAEEGPFPLGLESQRRVPYSHSRMCLVVVFVFRMRETQGEGK